MNRDLEQNMNELIRLALQEDLGLRGDITSDALMQHHGTATILARQQGCVAGLVVAQRVFHAVNRALNVDILLDEGDFCQKDSKIMQISGSVLSILTAERTALNFLARLSGIATMTRQFTDKISHTKARLLDTRKTTPGWRLLEKDATRIGGAQNHRTGLWDMFLIKENHIKSAGSITKAVNACRRYMQSHGFKVKIEVEAQTPDEVQEALASRVDQVMLDNMTLEEMRSCVKQVDGRVALEASGNVTLDRVALIAETGVDYISVGAITHSAPAFDFTLLVSDSFSEANLGNISQ